MLEKILRQKSPPPTLLVSLTASVILSICAPVVTPAQEFKGGNSAGVEAIKEQARQKRQRIIKLARESTELLKQKDYRGVVRVTTEGLDLSPKSPHFLSHRAYAYMYLKMREEAIIDYTQLLKITPSASSYFNRSQMYAALGQTKMQLKDLDEAIKLTPTARLLTKKAQTHTDLGELDNTIAAAKRALTLLDSEQADKRKYIEAECYEIIGSAYLGKNNSQAALVSLNKVIQEIKGWPPPLKKRPRETAHSTDLLLTLHWRMNCYLRRGEAYEKLGKLKEAIADYEMAVKNIPESFTYRRSLLRAYKKTNQPEKALVLINQMLTEDDSPDLYYKRAEIYKKLGKDDLAKVDLARAKKTESALMGN